MTCSEGQEQAIWQLEEIAEASNGALSIVEIEPPPAEGARLKVRISLSTRGFQRKNGGLPLNAREGIRIEIPWRFPDLRPSAYAPHKRFAGYPHVQWSNYLCLYQSGTEWNPADGMFGFSQRLVDWLRAAAKGELDPDDAPLHPPAVYTSADVKIISTADTPDLPDDSWHWVGGALLTKKRDKRIDIVGWSELDGEIPEGQFGAAAVLLNTPLTFEYPSKVSKLLFALSDRGLPISLMLKLLRLYALQVPEGEPVYFVLGAPMRRVHSGGALKQHLSVWRIDAAAAADLRATLGTDETESDVWQAVIEWAASANTEWCRVYENRPEVTVRRDSGSPAQWLHGKRVLLLGCGALGSFVGEYLARASCATIDLVDEDVVSPGVLVRQLYTDHYVGYAKSNSLRLRLDGIQLGAAITHHVEDLDYGVLRKFDPSKFDLIVDATASRQVSRVIERETADGIAAPPIVSMCVSSKAEFGMVTVRGSGFIGGPLDISRRAQLAVFRKPATAHFASAFWPERDQIKLFQPEPGCSEPTFVGSVIDMSYHSAGLMSIALERLASSLPTDSASADFLSKPLSSGRQSGRAAFTFSDVESMTEACFGYSVIVSRAARRGIEATIKQNARERSPDVETGGLMFGAIDDALKRIWLDEVSGPPPDSVCCAERFLCGVDGTRDLAAATKKLSGGASSFLGIWHTHPVSPPSPSDVDLSAMAQILLAQDNSPRQTLMLIVGLASTNPTPACYLFRRQDLVAAIEAWRAAKGGASV